MTDARRQHELDFALDLEFDHILTNPILDIGARVWESDRYRAFQVCYRSMRRIDDLVDNRKESGSPITPGEIRSYEQMIDRWIQALTTGSAVDDFQAELIDIRARFAIPVWPWQRLGRAMVYDLHHNGFRSMLAFRRYTEGAAIAPASIFMHLCGITGRDGEYDSPEFDIRSAAKDLALFSYFVHIIRDFQKDHLRSLNYFPDSMLREFGLTLKEVRGIAHGEPISAQFRSLVAAYRQIADFYRRRARRVLNSLAERLASQYQLSLEIIYHLYLQIFERIDPVSGSFTSGELSPPPDEVHERLQRTIEGFINRSG